MERASEAGTTLVFMPRRGKSETGATLRRMLEGDGLSCTICEDAHELECHLMDPSREAGAVLVSPRALQQGGREVLERFQEREPAWSSMPIVLLTPDEQESQPPLQNLVLLQEPVSWRELCTVMRVALGFRTRQRDLMRLHEHLEQLALGDPLTGLANRTALYRKLVELQQGRRGGDHDFAVIFLDLDDFKSINDTYGHAAGDEALQQVATYLKRSVRADDFVARFSGDEFIAVLVGVDCVERATAAAQRLSEGVSVRLGPHGQAVTISASAGILEGISADAAPDAILAQADAHMYAAKHVTQRAQHSN